MDTQNTPIHIRLWNKDFWLLSIAHLLLITSMYILIPAIPARMQAHGYSGMETGLAMGAMGIGIFLFGGFVSYLIKAHSRNRVCQYSILCIIACIACLYYIDSIATQASSVRYYFIIRLLMGAFYGLAEITLMSTLIIDTCESFQRTEANYSFSWFGRLALAIGPLASILIYRSMGYANDLLMACSCAFAAIILISSVHFTPKAPGEILKIFSLDRFFLPQGFLLFISTVLVTTILGLVFSTTKDPVFYAMLITGFFFSFLAEKYAFANADLKSEALTGLICIGTAILLLITRYDIIVNKLAPALIGFGISLIGSRFLLFFVKLSKHCQRGTSQSSYFLGWEAGLSLGLFLGYGILSDGNKALIVAFILTIVTLFFYNFIVHPWYMKHKNR